MKLTGPFSLLLLVSFGLIGCSSETPVSPSTTIYVNADVVTMNDAQPNAEAIAVRAGSILAVGTRAEVGCKYDVGRVHER